MILTVLLGRTRAFGPIPDFLEQVSAKRDDSRIEYGSMKAPQIKENNTVASQMEYDGREYSVITVLLFRIAYTFIGNSASQSYRSHERAYLREVDATLFVSGLCL